MSWPRGVWAVGVVVGVVVGLLWLLLLWSVAKDVVCPSLMLMMAAQIKILIVLYIWIKEKLMDTATSFDDTRCVCIVCFTSSRFFDNFKTFRAILKETFTLFGS